MTYLSILEKFKILFDMIINYKVVLIWIVGVLILSMLLIIKKINKSKYTIFMFITLIASILYSYFSNYKILSNTFDNFMTILFTNIYFPSIYVYIVMLFVVLVSFIISIISDRTSKLCKCINTIIFVLNSILFIIILNIIAKSKIDIFSISSLYTNVNLVAILEISTFLFILWVGVLLAIYITDVICIKIKFKKSSTVLEDGSIINNALVEGNADENIVNDMIEDTTFVSDISMIESSISDDNNMVIDDIVTADKVDTAETTINNVDAITASDNMKDSISVNAIEEVSPIIDNTNINTNIEIDASVIEDNDSRNKYTFDDILNGLIPVNYDSASVVTEKLSSNVDPEKIITDKYNMVRPISMQDVITDIDIDNYYAKKSASINEKLKINSVSLNELSIEDTNIIIENNDIDNTASLIEDTTSDSVKDNNSSYTIEDYKRILKMLKQLKIHTRGNKISMDDAISLSLIGNYSYEDCVKFRNILESNFN